MRFSPRHWILLLLILSCHLSLAADTQWQGRPLVDFIAWLVERDVPIIYSTDLVLPEFTMVDEPVTDDPLAALRDALKPHRLILTDGPGNSFLITRQRGAPDGAATAAEGLAAADNQPAPVNLTEIVVTSSLYSLQYDPAGPHTFLDREMTTQLPDIGNDAVRAIFRLPGIASGGLSTRSHVRGGIDNEQLFLFDGLRLYEPYHLKDFHSLSTIVDQNAVAGIDFYSAGYQVQFGDRMSGVIDMSMRQPEADTVTELSLSFFSASALSMGRFGNDDRGDWLINGRRGNLDLVVDVVNPDYGSPQFEDALMHLGWQLSDRTYISANLLASYDEISINQIDGSERANAKYRNRVAWLKAESDWTNRLSSSTILSITEIGNSRSGVTDIPDVVSGNLTDDRDFNSVSLRQDWKWQASGSWLYSAGFDLKHLDSAYDFDSTLNILPPFDQILDNQPNLSKQVLVSPEGAQYAAYLESRWRPLDTLILDAGIRWDQQTYTVSENDDQVSMRFNLLYFLGDRTELRLGAGRYYQAQEINELQVTDGVETFFPAQRATHIVASLAHELSSGAELRLELYEKKYGSLMPRFENIFDSLVLIPELQIDRLMINAGGARSKGAEIRITGEEDDDKPLWWLSYTWSVIDDTTSNGNVRRSWDQTHAVKAGINWDWKKWNFSAAGSAHSGWPRTDLLVQTITNPDGSTDLLASTTQRNSLRHGTFQSLDARASRRFDITRGELTVFLEITNIFDQENTCCTKYGLQTDSNGNQTLQVDTRNWLPLIPSLGVIWQF
jgi:outer membrane receptor protein involved in Fe transport